MLQFQLSLTRFRQHRESVNPELTAAWRDKAGRCLKSTDGKAFGPNGEKVVFKIYNGIDPDSAPPSKKIGIRASGRAHSRSWTIDVDCSTILHELLHLTGLVDEYPETLMGYVQDSATGKWRFVQTNAERTAFDCRRLYKRNSIMADNELAWSSALAEWNMRMDFCRCNSSDGCKSYFDQQKQAFDLFMQKGPGAFRDIKTPYSSQCPAGFEKSIYFLEYPIPDGIKKQYDEGKPMGSGLPKGMTAEDAQKMPPIFTFKSRSAAIDRNILEPRHFNAIVFPGCINKNRDYYQDSMNAYRTSERNGGKGCADLSWSAK